MQAASHIPRLDAEEILQYACNGFIDWEHSPHSIDVLVDNRLDNHINRAEFYKNWKKIAPAAGRKGYSLYKVISVHGEFRDIIPTILKHMPDMIVLYPLELVDMIQQKIEAYNMSIRPYLMSDLNVK